MSWNTLQKFYDDFSKGKRKKTQFCLWVTRARHRRTKTSKAVKIGLESGPEIAVVQEIVLENFGAKWLKHLSMI